MEGLAYAAALALALVFTIAGIAKLRRRPATARAFAGLGLASPKTLAVGVPVAELGLAAGLVVVPAWAGIVALAVLAGFTTFVVRAVRRGEPQGCGCFGATRPAPMGAAEVVRNGWLVLAATLAAFASGPVVPRPLELAAVAGMAVAGAGTVAAVASRRRPTLGNRQGPPRGSPAPAVPGLHRDGTRTTLVAFLAPGCEGCAELRSTLQRLSLPDLDVQVVDLDDRSASSFDAFDVVAPPFVVVIDSQGLVRASGPARSDRDIDRLIA
ncbi:MAG TPA: MauE/DoxX family redox-associated membrane protein [Acidimicrobiales bacterium]|nr:MauE/DoxX family redox-associated membrane protein [Acidimicrobiales bacterium]